MAYIGNPVRANRMALLATSPKDIVPQRSSAVSQMSGAAGTTVRRMPSGTRPLCRV